MRSIAFDSPHGADQKRTAFVRLMPPPLPWRSAEQEVRCPGPLWAPATCHMPEHIKCHGGLPPMLLWRGAAASPENSLAQSAGDQGYQCQQ